jgi:putative transposase
VGTKIPDSQQRVAFPSSARKIIYTTNAIENINSQLRKIIKTRGHFPSDEAAIKLIWLALRNITANRGSAAHDWKTAMNQFAILYADRLRYLIEHLALPRSDLRELVERVGAHMRFFCYWSNEHGDRIPDVPMDIKVMMKSLGGVIEIDEYPKRGTIT